MIGTVPSSDSPVRDPSSRRDAPSATAFKRPVTAQEAVLAEIRRQMLDGRLPPGAAVRPDAIGEQLGVSAVPVREALRILEGEGHVDYRPHRGYVVAALDVEDLVEVYRIRELLETEAVRRAIPDLADDDVARLREILAQMEVVREDILALTAVNRQFHFVLFEASGMPLLVRLLRNLWDFSDRYRMRYLTAPENRKFVHDQHLRMMRAISTGDCEAFVNESRLHRSHAVKALVEAVPDAGRAADGGRASGSAKPAPRPS